MAYLAINDPPVFSEKIYQVEEEDYITADLENEVKGALLNNNVFLKALIEEEKKARLYSKELEKADLLTVQENGIYYVKQAQHAPDERENEGYFKVMNHPNQSEENRMIFWHPCASSSGGYFNVLTEGRWLGWQQMASISDLKQLLMPKAAEITQNPENYQAGQIYSIEGTTSEENGHPYSAEWTHLTYFVYGDEHAENGYKNIVGVDYRGKMYRKSQYWNQWTDWEQLVTLKELEDMRERMSNPNLLINSNFKNPINQRGKSIYDSLDQYTIDRWYKQNGTVFVRNGYIELYRTGHENSFCQFVELDEVEQTFTFSVCTAENKIYSNTQYIKDVDNTYSYTEVEEYKIRMSYDSSRKLLKTEIYCDGSNDSAILKLKWAKLEYGEIATRYVSPNLVENLLKCQRYYYRINRGTYDSIIYLGIAISTTNKRFFYLTLALPVEMRVDPTLDFGDGLECELPSNSVIHTANISIQRSTHSPDTVIDKRLITLELVFDREINDYLMAVTLQQYNIDATHIAFDAEIDPN